MHAPHVALMLLALAGLTALATLRLEPPDTLPEPPAGKVWKLVWHDEFDGTELDDTKWETPPDAPRRDGWWMRKAIAFDGQGHLAIRCFHDGEKYVDGCIRTRGRYEKALGYFVCRAKLQRSHGHWSAFWLYNACVGNIGNGAVDGAEIDIFEKPWLDDRVQQTLHWDGYGRDHKSEGFQATVPGVMDGWHTFGLWWSEDAYIFYVDGQETWRTNAGGICREPLYIKLSDEIGPWAGDIKTATLPDQFEVDYVRVYDLAERTEVDRRVGSRRR